MSVEPAPTTSWSAVSRIVAHCARQHANLLDDIAALAHAPKELAELEQRLRDITVQIDVDEKKIKDAQSELYATYNDPSDSLIRKAGSLVTGQGDKWKAKQAEVQNAHQEAQDRLFELNNAISRGRAALPVMREKITSLRPLVEHHAELTSDLDELYAQIFDNQQRDEASDVDILLWDFRRSEASRMRARELHVMETKTVSHLVSARVALNECAEDLLKAKQHSATGNEISMKKDIVRGLSHAEEYRISVRQAAALNSAMGSAATSTADKVVTKARGLNYTKTSQKSYNELLYEVKETVDKTVATFFSEVDIAERRMKRAESQAKCTSEAYEDILKVLRQHRQDLFTRILANEYSLASGPAEMGAHAAAQQAIDGAVSPPAYQSHTV